MESGSTGSADVDVDELITKAYGTTVLNSGGVIDSDAWYKWWQAVVHLQGKVYALPGGNIGCKYVDLLSEEVLDLSVGNYPANRLIVFSALMLLRDRMVRKAVDIK